MVSYLLNEGRCVTRWVEKWIRWIPLINGRFKLNIGGSRVQNNSVVGWVIRDCNGILKMVACKHIGNSSIIITKCMTLRDSILTPKNKAYFGFRD